jgi:DHA2 family multidrug resistance protein
MLPEGMAIFHLVRNIASSVHISISVSLIVYYTSVNYAGLVEGISLFNEVARDPAAIGMWSFDSPSSIAALSGEIVRQASMVGYLNVFLLYACTAFAVLPLIALVKNPQAEVLFLRGLGQAHCAVFTGNTLPIQMA